MVNINLTFFIELGLFLLFLWVAARFILRPALQTIDAREERLEQDRKSAEALGQDAESAEAEYQRAVAAARVEAEQHFFEVQTRAMEASAARLNEARKAADDAVAAIRAKGEAELEKRQADLERVAPGVAESIARSMNLGGGAR